MRDTAMRPAARRAVGLLTMACFALTLALPASAQAPSPPKSDPVFLTKPEMNPDALLPAPPLDGSAAALAELAELHRIEAARTPEDFERAKWDDEHEDVWAFSSVLGPRFNASDLPLTAALFAKVSRDAGVAAKLAKVKFARTRPWNIDKTLKACPHEDSAVKSSYPSGHATFGYATAIVLAELIPDQAATILNRANQYGENRLVCEHHFRRDIVAGETLGTAVGVMLLHNDRFKAELAGVRAELKSKGF